MVSDVGSTPNTNHSESNVKSTGDVNVRKDRAQYLSDIGDDDWNNSSVMSWVSSNFVSINSCKTFRFISDKITH